MARYGSGDVGFLLSGGYDLLNRTTDLQLEREAVIEEVTALGDDDVQHAPVGLKRATISQDGFYDDAANGINTALVGLAERVLTVGIEGNTLGKQFVGVAGAVQHSYTRQLSRGVLHKARAQYRANGVVEDGKILHVHQAETADPLNSASVDNAASSANGGAGYLEVPALTLGGFTNVTFKTQHSVDDSVWVDLVTFTAVTAAPTAERKTVTGTVNRYLRNTHDFVGAGAGQSVTYMHGFVRS